ncbi:hypothetical protein AHAS_Ahas18G0174200 [Arachis hypogaea]
MLRRWFIGIWWWLLTIIIRVTISIRLICIRMRVIPIRIRRLLPIRMINSLRLLPFLLVPSIMSVIIEVHISYNTIRIKLIAKVRIHSGKAK